MEGGRRDNKRGAAVAALELRAIPRLWGFAP